MRVAVFLSLPLVLATGVPPLHAEEEAPSSEQAPLAITVTATRTERPVMKSPGNITVVDSEELRGEGVADSGDLVRTQPGVSAPFEFTGADSFVPYRRGGFSSFRMRGVEGNRVLVTIDGIRLPPQFELSGGNGRDFYDPAVFGRVEILQGAGSTLYGSDAMGGVVAFDTLSLLDALIDSPKPWILRSRTSFYTVNESVNQVIEAGWREGDWAFTLVDSVRFGHETRNDKGNVPANPQDFHSNHAVGKVFYTPAADRTWTFTVEDFRRSSETEVNSAEQTLTSPLVYDVFNESEDRRNRVSLAFEDLSGNDWWDTLETQLYLQHSETDSLTEQEAGPALAPPPTTRDRTDDIGFEHTVLGGSAQVTRETFLAGLPHQWVAGVEFAAEDAENTFLRTDRAPVVQPVDNRAGFTPSDLYRFDVYLQDVVETGRWFFQAGLRAGWYALEPGGAAPGSGLPDPPDYDNVALSPSFSVQYEWSADTVLWARYARGIRNPSIEDYVGYFDHLGQFQQLPNPGLTEETSNAFDLGLKHDGAFWVVELNAFYTDYDGFIEEQVLPGGNLRQENIGRVEIYGLDARVLWSMEQLNDSLEGFSLGLRANQTRGRNKTDDDWVNSVDPFTAVAFLDYDHPEGTWGARLAATYRDEQDDYTRDFLLYVPPASTVVDLTFYWQVAERVRLSGGVRNLTDERYWIWPNADSVDHNFNEDPELAVQPGLNAYITLEASF